MSCNGKKQQNEDSFYYLVGYYISGAIYLAFWIDFALVAQSWCLFLEAEMLKLRESGGGDPVIGGKEWKEPEKYALINTVMTIFRDCTVITSGTVK